MGMLSKKLRSLEGGRVAYWCQGCGHLHQINVGDGPGPRWGYNNNPEAPTFTPSVRVTWTEPANLHNPEAMQRDLEDVRARRADGDENARVPLANKVCHTFITDGRVQFLGDCTHQYAGQTLDLPDLPGDWTE